MSGAVTIEDHFTGADETSINSRTPDVVSSGSVWSDPGGKLKIISNKMVNAGAYVSLNTTLDAGLTEYDVSADYEINGDNGGGIMFRSSADGSGSFLILISRSDIGIRYDGSNPWTSFAASPAMTYGNVYNFRIHVTSSGFEVFQGGVSLGSVTTTYRNTETHVGVYNDAYGLNNKIDNFIVDDGVSAATATPTSTATPVPTFTATSTQTPAATYTVTATFTITDTPAPTPTPGVPNAVRRRPHRDALGL